MNTKARVEILRCDNKSCDVPIEVKKGEISNSYIKSNFKSVHILWKTPPKVVLVDGKYFDKNIRETMVVICQWLKDEKNLNVLVSDKLLEYEPIKSNFESYSTVKNLDKIVDFCIAIGGDGTLLHINSLFKKSVPPIIPFACGSLGFLTTFDVTKYESIIDRVLEGNFSITPRSRLKCRVIRYNDDQNNSNNNNNNNNNNDDDDNNSNVNNIDVNNENVEEIIKFTVLNEVIITRGGTDFIGSFDMYCDNTYITTVVGDGVTIATATGSTAYSLSAGGSMIHPTVPSILFTPILPHSLSFRPVVLPDTINVQIKIPFESRSFGIARFDGKNSTPLAKGDVINISVSPYPLCTVSQTDNTSEWFSALARCLMWNVRSNKQKELPNNIMNDNTDFSNIKSAL